MGYKHQQEMEYNLECHMIIIYSMNCIYNTINIDTDLEGVRLYALNRDWNKNFRRETFYKQKQYMAYAHKHLVMLRVTLPLN